MEIDPQYYMLYLHLEVDMVMSDVVLRTNHLKVPIAQCMDKEIWITEERLRRVMKMSLICNQAHAFLWVEFRKEFVNEASANRIVMKSKLFVNLDWLTRGAARDYLIGTPHIRYAGMIIEDPYEVYNFHKASVGKDEIYMVGVPTNKPLQKTF